MAGAGGVGGARRARRARASAPSSHSRNHRVYYGELKTPRTARLASASADCAAVHGRRPHRARPEPRPDRRYAREGRQHPLCGQLKHLPPAPRQHRRRAARRRPARGADSAVNMHLAQGGLDGVRQHWAVAPATGSLPCSSHASVAHTATRLSSCRHKAPPQPRALTTKNRHFRCSDAAPGWFSPVLLRKTGKNAREAAVCPNVAVLPVCLGFPRKSNSPPPGINQVSHAGRPA